MRMSSTVKILLGALAAAVFAWFLHGPMGFGKQCATPAKPVIAEAPAVPTPAVK